MFKYIIIFVYIHALIGLLYMLKLYIWLFTDNDLDVFILLLYHNYNKLKYFINNVIVINSIRYT